MDPQATLDGALEACIGGNADEAAYLFDELATWIRRGGFCPKVEKVRGFLGEYCYAVQ